MSDQRFKADKGIWAIGPNSTFESNVYVNGSTFFIGVDLIIGGNLVYANTSLAGDLIPSIPGSALGNTASRFFVYATSIDANTQIMPTTNGLPLGNNTNRWLVYTQNVNSNGTITVTGNVAVNTTALVVDATNKRVGVNSTPGAVALTVVGESTLTGNVVITGTANVSSGLTASSINLPNSAIFTNTATVTNTSSNVIDSFAKASWHAAKMVMFVDGSALATPVIHAIEMLLIHDGTNVLVTKYGEVYNTSLGSFDAAINGANVEITFTASAANTYYVKTQRQSLS